MQTVGYFGESDFFFFLFLTIYLQVVKSLCVQAVCAEMNTHLIVQLAQVGRGLMDQLELLSHKAEKPAQCCADTASLGHVSDENGATGQLHAHGPFSGGSTALNYDSP